MTTQPRFLTVHLADFGLDLREKKNPKGQGTELTERSTHSFSHRPTAPPSDGGLAESRRPQPHRTIRGGVRRWYNGCRLIETTSRRHVTSPKPGVGPPALGRAPPHFPRFLHVFSFLSSLLSLPSNRALLAGGSCRVPPPSRSLAVLAPEASPVSGEASPTASSADEPLPCELSPVSQSPLLSSRLFPRPARSYRCVARVGPCAGDRGVINGI